MHLIDRPPALSSLVAHDVAGCSASEAAEIAKPILASERLCLLSGFPSDADAYLAFLEAFGEPLPNYSSLSALATEDPHPQINRVRFKKPKTGEAKSVHHVAGGLRPHSGRSWRTPRPRYFAMLMIDPGWRDFPPGERGESVVLRWEKLFEWLAARDGATFERHFSILSSTPIRFEANNVQEAFWDAPLCYPIFDSRGPYDVGVRLKQDLLDKLDQLADQLPDRAAYQRAIEYLVREASEPDAQICFPLQAGELIIIDNNRYGHGRRSILGERMKDGVLETNPRELWSVTVA